MRKCAGRGPVTPAHRGPMPLNANKPGPNTAHRVGRSRYQRDDRLCHEAVPRPEQPLDDGNDREDDGADDACGGQGGEDRAWLPGLGGPLPHLSPGQQPLPSAVAERSLTDLLSGRRRDVAVHAEQVVGVVGGLGALKALVVVAVGGGGPSGVVLGELEVDVVPAGREGPDPLPRIPDPGHVRVGGGAGRPGTGEPTDIPGVAVANRPVVALTIIQRTGEVKEN
jgi:hypothetical protein